MTEDTAKRSIDWLHSTGCRVLAYMGGEPLLRPDFIHKITYYAATKDRGGIEGYGQRLGATFAGGYTNILIGSAVLPSLLHQDPRYFYQGTGTNKSRLLHAVSYAVSARGDNGRREINFSAIGGDLASGAMANAYYPTGERGDGLVFRSALIGIGGRMANGVTQEFVLHKHRP